MLTDVLCVLTDVLRVLTDTRTATDVLRVLTDVLRVLTDVLCVLTDVLCALTDTRTHTDVGQNHPRTAKITREAKNAKINIFEESFLKGNIKNMSTKSLGCQVLIKSCCRHPYRPRNSDLCSMQKTWLEAKEIYENLSFVSQSVYFIINILTSKSLLSLQSVACLDTCHERI